MGLTILMIRKFTPRDILPRLRRRLPSLRVQRSQGDNRMSDRRIALTDLQHKTIPQVRGKQALQLSRGLRRKCTEVSVFLVIPEHSFLRRTADRYGGR